MIIKNPITLISGRIPWHITSSMEAPTTPGKPGDVVIITSSDVSSVKSVSSVNLSYDALQENSVNLILDTSGTECRLLLFDKWSFGGKFNGVNVNVNGTNQAYDVYVWNTITNSWLSLKTLFLDILSFDRFLGATLTAPDYFGANGFNLVEQKEVIVTIPILNTPTETLVFSTFMGSDLVAPDYFGATGFNLADSPVINITTSGGGGQVYPPVA